jgi:hypothetical protein
MFRISYEVLEPGFKPFVSRPQLHSHILLHQKIQISLLFKIRKCCFPNAATKDPDFVHLKLESVVFPVLHQKIQISLLFKIRKCCFPTAASKAPDFVLISN